MALNNNLSHRETSLYLDYLSLQKIYRRSCKTIHNFIQCKFLFGARGYSCRLRLKVRDHMSHQQLYSSFFLIPPIFQYCYVHLLILIFNLGQVQKSNGLSMLIKGFVMIQNVLQKNAKIIRLVVRRQPDPTNIIYTV